MPTFKVKDLMVNIGQACILHTTITGCVANTTQTFCRIGCHSYISVTCAGCSVVISCPYHTCHLPTFIPTPTITPTITPTTPQLPIEQLDIEVLREQLKAQLVALDEQEAAINEELRPKTLEDLVAVETKLNEALADVKVQKNQLQKKK